MRIIPGTVKKGKVVLNAPIPAEDGMTVLVFLLPKTVESNSSEDLFGKWFWYTDDIDREVRNAWQKWAEKAKFFMILLF